jgi:hypothetical protein
LKQLSKIPLCLSLFKEREIGSSILKGDEGGLWNIIQASEVLANINIRQGEL